MKNNSTQEVENGIEYLKNQKMSIFGGGHGDMEEFHYWV